MGAYTAAAGTAHVMSSCWVAIDHTSGWQTRYYHLKNIDRNINGKAVAAGQQIADAGQPGTETCGTGTKDFRHVHFSLWRSGREVSVNGISIGGYTVHAGGKAYCGYWTRDRDKAVVVDARRTCYAIPKIVDNQKTPDARSRYIGHIVQWSGDTKAQKTAWLVGSDLRRRWIPNTATYRCLKGNGARGPDRLSSSVLNQLKDLTGVKASCKRA
jgi:murein DD-endopeptidase MepM/ murein hydrolase activator NlpD